MNPQIDLWQGWGSFNPNPVIFGMNGGGASCHVGIPGYCTNTTLVAELPSPGTGVAGSGPANYAGGHPVWIGTQPTCNPLT